MTARAIDFSGVGQVLFVEFAIVGKQLRKTENRVQRRAQFVTHARQELGLGLVCLLGLVLGLDQRRFALLALGNVFVDGDYPLPGIFVTSHHGDQRPGFEV